jgi:hypothetical protein
VFITPNSIKAIHHHKSELIAFKKVNNISEISKSTKSCPICNFEFVNFIFKDSSPDFYIKFENSFKKPELIIQEYKFSFTAYLHRAPPLTFS